MFNFCSEYLVHCAIIWLDFILNTVNFLKKKHYWHPSGRLSALLRLIFGVCSSDETKWSLPVMSKIVGHNGPHLHTQNVCPLQFRWQRFAYFECICAIVVLGRILDAISLHKISCITGHKTASVIHHHMLQRVWLVPCVQPSFVGRHAEGVHSQSVSVHRRLWVQL